MKKLITLLIAAGSFATVNAQSTKEEARKVILGDPKNNGGTPSKQGRDIILGGGSNGSDENRNHPTSTNAQIDQVNREYDAKVNSIRNNGTLTQAEKERMISQLEKDRARRIKQITNANNGHHDDDDDHQHDKKVKKNNGKHLGWEKGKGNPHKKGGDSGKGKKKG